MTYIDSLKNLFSPDDLRLISQLAKKQNKIEKKWKDKFKKYSQEQTAIIVKKAIKTGRLDFSSIDYGSLLIEHKYDVTKEAYQQAKNTPAKSSLAGKAKAKMGIVERIRKEYETYKKKKKLPKDLRKKAQELKRDYIKKLQALYQRSSEDFREGKKVSQEEIVERVQDAMGIGPARATTIVNTETTRYYNDTRREFYDELDAVTHYLFVCIRDQRTTKWCKTRDKLVYEKESEYLKKETPPVHWNCRSELLPLTKQNPEHRRYINSKARARENNSPARLPPGWTK